MRISMPAEAEKIINTLKKSGYSAYAVGGCVRDSLSGNLPEDWDICTSALPEQVKKCFADCRIIETGIKHGTVAIMDAGTLYEVTTFRTDGVYTDNRRPDRVFFVDRIEEDLARRDFTINAMAYSAETGLIDPFGGERDLARGIIRCVGDPDERFSEDALRIMRALRFASVSGFTVEEETKESIHRKKDLLSKISAERTNMELCKLLLGRRAGAILAEYGEVFFVLIPELEKGRWKEAAKEIASAGEDLYIRLALLFIPCEEPQQVPGILKRLKFDNETLEIVGVLTAHRDAYIEKHRIDVKRWLRRMGEQKLRLFVKMKKLEEVSALIDEVIESGQCYNLTNLEINGIDVIEAGVPEGVAVGRMLNHLLDMVIAEEIPNEKELLRRLCSEMNAKSRLL